MSEQFRLPNSIVSLKKKLVEINGFTSHEINDMILDEIKRDFTNLSLSEFEEGKTKCNLNLNPTEEKFFNTLRRLYGISFCQLYIRATIKIAQQQKII